jgi:2-polyprenyl-3-methyl-5-hydroxy-6-metoxy-1,4-benzoquinol methylase
VANEWDATAAVYEDQFEQVTGTTVPRLVEWLAPSDGKTFADVACGPGVVTMALAERGAFVRASDFSDGMVQRATAPPPSAGSPTALKSSLRTPRRSRSPTRPSTAPSRTSA